MDVHISVAVVIMETTQKSLNTAFTYNESVNGLNTLILDTPIIS